MQEHKNGLDFANKNSFFNNYTTDVFMFVTAIISLVVMSIVMSIICEHTKLKHKLLPCLQQRLPQVYGKMYIHITGGVVMENFILHNIFICFNFV